MRRGADDFFRQQEPFGERELLPLCLLPTSKSFPSADAIVITDEFVITIQVTVSDQHSTKGSGFTDIKKLIPHGLRRDNWRHVFITDDDDDRAVSLRNQTLRGLPEDILVYSGVFDIGPSSVTRKHMEAFNEKKSKRELAARDCCLLGNQQPAHQQPLCRNSMVLDDPR